MSCVTDPQAPIQICDLVVLEASYGAPVRVQFTANPLPSGPFGVFSGGSDVFTGVVTIDNASGVPIVVATFTHESVSVGSVSKPVFLETHEDVASSWLGQTIHIAVGPSYLFDYQPGDVFVPNPTAMLRTSVTLPAGVPRFRLVISSLPYQIGASATPSMSVLVQNVGSGSGETTVTAITSDPSTGQDVAQWTSVTTRALSPGSSQLVTLRQIDPVGPAYVGRVLTVTVSDDRGDTVQGTYLIQGTGTGAVSVGPTGTGIGSTPTAPAVPGGINTAAVIAGGAVVLGGALLVYLGFRLGVV